MSQADKTTDTQVTDLLIDGKWVEPAQGYFEVVNPSNGEVVGRAASASRDQVDEAVQSARDRFESWRERPARERG